MVNYPTKEITVTAGSTETVYMNGHPRHDAVRVDVDTALADNTESLVATFKPAQDDDPANIAPGDLEYVHQAEVNGSDGYGGAGTTAVSRTMVVELAATGTDITVEVKSHPKSDPAETGHGFAYYDTYRSNKTYDDTSA